MRVKDLEAGSGLSDGELGTKRETAKIEGRQVAAIGACGSVPLAFQVLDELRRATGQPYPDAESHPTKAEPSSSSGVSKKNKPDVRSLICEWKNAYIACRGGFGSQESTWAACGKRDDIAEELARSGYCEERSPDASPIWAFCHRSKNSPQARANYVEQVYVTTSKNTDSRDKKRATVLFNSGKFE